MIVYEDKCLEFGLDPKRVASIARRIERAMLEADQLGISLFGGSGSGTLRYRGSKIQGPGHSEIAFMRGSYDGGDGGDIFSG